MHVIGGDAPLRCRLTIREAMAYPVELPLEASVQHRAAASTSTASSSTTWRAPRACGQRPPLVVGERDGGAHARAHPPKVLVHRIHGRAKKSRSSASLANVVAASSSSRPMSSVWLRSFASAKSAFAYGAAARRGFTG